MGDDKGPGFSFTTGFWVNANQPELVIFSMKDVIAHQVLWDMYRDAQEGHALQTGKRTDAVFGNLPAYAFRVDKKRYAEFLGWSQWSYADDKFPCLQIVWPDRVGLFPWERDFAAEFINDQPDLSERGWLNEITD